MSNCERSLFYMRFICHRWPSTLGRSLNRVYLHSELVSDLVIVHTSSSDGALCNDSIITKMGCENEVACIHEARKRAQYISTLVPYRSFRVRDD